AEKPTLFRIQGGVYGGSRIGIFSIGKAVISSTKILNKRRCILNALVELDETRAIINRAADEGFELPSQTEILSIDQLIYDYRQSGFWDLQAGIFDASMGSLDLGRI